MFCVLRDERERTVIGGDNVTILLTNGNRSDVCPCKRTVAAAIMRQQSAAEVWGQ